MLVILVVLVVKMKLDFFNWYSKLPYKYIILIAGNHDFL
jgi:hypothetical protein